MLSLIGLSVTAGFPAGAVSRAEFQSALRDAGMLGFQRGTVLKEEVRGGSFIDAVLIGDAHLLLQRVHDRLNGPFTDFMKDLYAVDAKGRNVFHVAAAAEKNQDLFADIMESLIRVSGFHIEADKQEDKPIEAANMIVSPLPNLEKSYLIKNILAANKKEDVYGAVLKEIEKFIKERPAVTVLSYLHSVISVERFNSGNSGESAFLQTFEQSFLEFALSNDLYCDDGCWEGVSIHRPWLMRDAEGFLPIDIAKKNGNLPSFSHLYKHNDRSFWQNVAVPLAAGSAWTIAVAAGAVPGLDSPSQQVIAGFFGGVTVASALTVCHASFAKAPVRLAKIKKALAGRAGLSNSTKAGGGGFNKAPGLSKAK